MNTVVGRWREHKRSFTLNLRIRVLASTSSSSKKVARSCRYFHSTPFRAAQPEKSKKPPQDKGKGQDPRQKPQDSTPQEPQQGKSQDKKPLGIEGYPEAKIRDFDTYLREEENKQYVRSEPSTFALSGTPWVADAEMPTPKLTPRAKKLMEILKKLTPFEAYILVAEVKKILEWKDIKDNPLHEFEVNAVYHMGLTPEPWMVGKMAATPGGTTPGPPPSQPPTTGQAPAENTAAKDKKGPPPKEEVKGFASIKLVSFPESNKLNVLKEIRKLKPGMNLTDSMKLVANLPQILVKGASPEDQKKWKSELEKTGAVIEFV